jgi:hypothetical protein
VNYLLFVIVHCSTPEILIVIVRMGIFAGKAARLTEKSLALTNFQS